MNYTVTTKFNDEIIEQTTELRDGFGSIVEVVSSQVIKMQESGIEEALVKMGWTPPAGRRLSSTGVAKKDT